MRTLCKLKTVIVSSLIYSSHLSDKNWLETSSNNFYVFCLNHYCQPQLEYPVLLHRKELANKAHSYGVETCLVRDAGRTQIAPGSRTVLGIGPGILVIDIKRLVVFSFHCKSRSWDKKMSWTHPKFTLHFTVNCK